MTNVWVLVAVGQSEDPERRPGWPRESGEPTGLHLYQNQAAGTVLTVVRSLWCFVVFFGVRADFFSIFRFFYDYFNGMI